MTVSRPGVLRAGAEIRLGGQAHTDELEHLDDELTGHQSANQHAPTRGDRLVDHQPAIGREAFDLFGRESEGVVDFRDQLHQGGDIGDPIDPLYRHHRHARGDRLAARLIGEVLTTRPSAATE